LRSDSGEPSKPDRFASTTTGRLPDAALIARATFFEDCGKSVPPFQDSGPSAGWKPSRGTLRLSMPISVIGWPPTCASQTIAVSPPTQAFQRSRKPPSMSINARITARIAKGRLRPGFVSSSKSSPTVARPSASPGASGLVAIERWRSSRVARIRGPFSPGTT
jgi:hypothetical protein